MKIDTNSNAPKRIFLSDYTAPDYKIKNVNLHFNLEESATRVKSFLQIEQLNEKPLILNGENLKLIDIMINNIKLLPSEFELSDDSLTIFATPKAFDLAIEVEINPEANKSCEGLYLSKGIFATQCEAESFRKITYFLDRPDVMTTYTVTIEADKKKYPVLLSNGDLISKKNLENNRHQTVWKDPFKKPCYLFALVAGDLGVVEGNYTTSSGKNVKLEVYASHGKQSRCLHALESLKKSMKWDEDRFGLEYDLNQYMIVSIDDFNMGAMENKGLNIFNSRLVLADPESATDTDFERIESVVGHEYFHNWTGNRVTCRNWFELSLKEGLTVFRDQEFSADMNSRAVQRIKDVDALRGSQFTEDAGPNSHPVRPESCLAVDNFYTATIYEKGSEVIRMMQTIVGKKGFRKGMDEYFKRYDGQAVTIIDFAEAIATPNNADFSQFKLWYSQSGTPEVNVSEKYDSDKKEYKLILNQFTKVTEKQPSTKPFHIPLLIGLIGSKGQDLPLISNDISFNSDEKPVLHLKNEVQMFTFSNVMEKPVLSLNREFSAPIKLHWNASEKELAHLIKYDSDSFNRREACYKMISQELQKLISDYSNKKNLSPNTQILDALGGVLNDSSIDAQFKALMLQLPDSDMLAQSLETLNAKALLAATKFFSNSFVEKYEKSLLDLYESHHAINKSGDRALKNRILRYLIDGTHRDSVALAFKQFKTAQNMTDSLGALVCLCQTESAEKNEALELFFNRWKDDAVVFNKWLQVQAVAALDSTFENVKKVSNTPPFSIENPNNIYSLHSLFASNYYAIQKDDGSTFKWFCDEIIKIDRQNPQVAARLCQKFNFVKKFAEPYKALAQKEIKRVLDEPNLSKNSRELLQGCI